MRWNPNAEDGDVDCRDDDECTPFDVADGISMFGNECNTIDDDLHEQLDLEHPEEEDEEQDRDAILWSGLINSIRDQGVLRGAQRSSQEEPANNSNAHVHNNLTPQHVDVDGSQRIAVPSRLLYGLPDC